MADMGSGIPQDTKPGQNNGGNAFHQLLQTFLGGSGRGPLPGWATQQPNSITQLLRQLSANAGQMPMPGGPVGAVRQQAFGSGRQPIQNPNMATYGSQPGSGEATFFQQSTRGGMSPISALTPLGVPNGWNPFAGYQRRVRDQRDKDKGGNGNGGGGGNGNGNYVPPGLDLADMGK